MKCKLYNKNYFILLFILVISNNILKSQTYLPPQQMFDVNRVVKYLSSNDSIFKFENKMKFGFHWGGEKKISDALGINFIEINSKLNENFLRHQRASNTDAYLTNSYLRDISEAMSMEWKVNLLIDTNKLDDLQTREHDPSKPVFGFSKIKGKITNTTSSDNRFGDYNYLNLDTCKAGDTILQGNSFNNKLYTNTDRLDSIYYNWNGKSWYLTVNLKKDSNYIYSQNNDTLFRVWIDYSYLDESNKKTFKIRYDSIPKLSAGSYEFENISNYNKTGGSLIFRGTRNKFTFDTSFSYFYITSKMLSANTNSTNGELNISAHFSILDSLNRFLFNHKNPLNQVKIYVQNMKENCPVKLNYIRIETPAARSLQWGFKDSLMFTDVDAKFVNPPKKNLYDSLGIKLKRIYLRDEGGHEYWNSYKYIADFVGDIVLIESGMNDAKLRNHKVPFRENWFITGGIEEWIANPYVKNVSNGNLWPKYDFGLARGYSVSSTYVNQVQYDNCDYNCAFNSKYETFVDTALKWNGKKQLSETQYPSINAGIMGSRTEERFFSIYYNKSNNNFLYEDKPWWSQINNDLHFNGTQIFDGQNWNEQSPFRINSNSRRQLTYEELNSANNIAMLFGAKGYSVDADSYGVIGETIDTSGIYKTLSGIMKLMKSGVDLDSTKTTTDKMAFLKDEEIGGDFIPLGANNPLDHFGFTKYVNFDSVPLKLGIPKHRLYVGQKSARIAFKHFYDKIRANETELLNLELLAGLGKGFGQFYTQNPLIVNNDTIMKSFIDINSIKTRPLGRTQGGSPFYEQSMIGYTKLDSGMYDITVLKNKDIPTDTVFYIGIANRRTDPLVYFKEGSDESFVFLSYSEFEDKCIHGGKYPLHEPTTANEYADTVWQKYWWKRLGAREINIPFDFVSTNKDHYNLLKVEELDGEFYNGTSKIADSLLPFHLKSKYYQHIDTVLGQNGNLVLNMLPGQGKILKVTVLKPDLTVTGELDHSNQTKLVAFPVLAPNGNETDSIQYHMVYYRNTPLSYNKKGVFYRRSKPIKKSDGTENIQWNSEILISNNIKVKDIGSQDLYCNFGLDSSKYYDCDYPSIVVRKIETDLRAFIVYSCNKGLPDNNENAFIGLSVLSVKDLINTNVLSKRVYEYYRASTLIPLNNPPNTTEFGNPVINASADYNFIAWSDAQRRIVVSYMKPDQYYLSDTMHVSNTNFGNLPNSISQHPSLNTYSKISAGENNCALVWQQKNSNSNPGIYYTRVRLDQNDSLEIYSSTNYKSSNISKINNIVKLNNKNNYCSFPVVLRDLRDFTYTSYPVNRQDYIYWSEFYTTSILGLPRIYKSSIAGTSIINSDINNTNTNEIYKLDEKNIVDFQFSSIDPNLSLPHGVYTSNNQKYNLGTHILNFKRTKGKLLGIFGGLDLIDNSTYNFIIGNSLFSQGRNNVLRGGTKIEKIATNTDQVHLAQHKENNYYNKVWRNRRVYEESNYSPPRIVSNGRYFYKNNEEELVENEGYVGFQKNTNSYNISNPYVNSQEVGLLLPYYPNPDTTEVDMLLDFAQDTIFSNWFDVNTVADLNFKCYGFNDTIMVAKIQKQSDNSFINLNLPLSTTDTTGKLGEYTLINGGLHTYRLCFIRLDTNYQYTETLVLDGLPVSDTVMLKGTESSKNIIDLSGNFNLTMNNDYFNIAISPNPANEIVYLTPLYNDLKNQNLVEVEILDNLGNSIHKKVVKSGETFSFITSELAQGIYVVNCKEVTSDWLAPSFLKATKFVVNR